MKKTILVTGAAGFIGSFLVKELLESTDDTILGLDNMSAYYDVHLKENRLQMLRERSQAGRFLFTRGDMADGMTVERMFSEHAIDVVVNLAAQAGVRYSIDNPRSYIESNLIGFFNVLEACRHHPVAHLVYASSSSVYGSNSKAPYSESDQVDSPVSLYAATKIADELLAHAYSRLYGIPCTGLRFFTVYGPMGRPDMAYFKFTDRIVRNETVQLYNNGDMLRDFTYVDDIVKGVMSVLAYAPKESHGDARSQIYNIGNGSPVTLLHFLETLERVLLEEGVVNEVTAHELLPMQPGDVYQTYADTSLLARDFGFQPSTNLEEGLREFARWYKRYFRIAG